MYITRRPLLVVKKRNGKGEDLSPSHLSEKKHDRKGIPFLSRWNRQKRDGKGEYPLPSRSSEKKHNRKGITLPVALE